MGAKLRAKLPDGNGLTEEVADKLAANPTYVPVLALLKVEDVTTHVDTGTTTTHLDILQIEPCAGVNAEQADHVHGLLRQMHEKRTGESALFEGDPSTWNAAGSPAGKSAGDADEYDRQVDLRRRELAAEAREQADNFDLKSGKHKDLITKAESYERGERDAEIRAELAPHFDDGSGTPPLEPAADTEGNDE